MPTWPTITFRPFLARLDKAGLTRMPLRVVQEDPRSANLRLITSQVVVSMIIFIHHNPSRWCFLAIQARESAGHLTQSTETWYCHICSGCYQNILIILQSHLLRQYDMLDNGYNGMMAEMLSALLNVNSSCP